MISSRECKSIGGNAGWKTLEPRLRFQFSKLLAQNGRMQDALSEARYCVALDPTNLRYRRHLVTLYAGDRNYIQALGNECWRHSIGANLKLKM